MYHISEQGTQSKMKLAIWGAEIMLFSILMVIIILAGMVGPVGHASCNAIVSLWCFL